MRCTVTMIPSAENELMRIWTDYPDRGAITRAANRIDNLLAVDPEQKGQVIHGQRRHLIEYPLEVVFRVYPDDCLVKILEVRHL